MMILGSNGIHWEDNSGRESIVLTMTSVFLLIQNSTNPISFLQFKLFSNQRNSPKIFPHLFAY